MGSAAQSTSKSGQLRNKVTAKKFTKKIDRKKEGKRKATQGIRNWVLFIPLLPANRCIPRTDPLRAELLMVSQTES